ncbi:hypothetical protein BC628DRAFT_1424053 [Trametes gibbosa]|nr:hypothetical protein BC628DRAFT_1424053 [Trametes gibbosa]
MPTWDFPPAYASVHAASSKPALARGHSKRRCKRPRSASRETLADASTHHNTHTDRQAHTHGRAHAYPGDNNAVFPALVPVSVPFPPRMSSDGENTEDAAEQHFHEVERGEAFMQRTVHRKKSSFDLRDMFLHGSARAARPTSRSAPSAYR